MTEIGPGKSAGSVCSVREEERISLCRCCLYWLCCLFLAFTSCLTRLVVFNQGANKSSNVLLEVSMADTPIGCAVTGSTRPAEERGGTRLVYVAGHETASVSTSPEIRSRTCKETFVPHNDS